MVCYFAEGEGTELELELELGCLCLMILCFMFYVCTQYTVHMHDARTHIT